MRLSNAITIGIDMNEDVRTGKLAQRLKAVRLKELILSTRSEASPSATFVRNNLRIPIDRLFRRKTVEVFQAGFLPFEAGPSAASSDGHRLIWAEVCNHSIYGKKYLIAQKQFKRKVYKQMILDAKRSYSRIIRREYNYQSIFATKKTLGLDMKRYKQGKFSHAKKIIKKYPVQYKVLHKELRVIKEKAEKFKN